VNLSSQKIDKVLDLIYDAAAKKDRSISISTAVSISRD